MKEYLTEEEQYKEVLNNEEISRIKDPELREIRSKFWNLKHQAFLNETEIPDTEIGKVYEELKAEEAKELNAYKNRNRTSF